MQNDRSIKITSFNNLKTFKKKNNKKKQLNMNKIKWLLINYLQDSPKLRYLTALFV